MISKTINQPYKKQATFQTYKRYNNKLITPSNKINTINNRYANINNKASAPIASNNYNNQFLYKSENKKGYNQMTLPTFSLNNDLHLLNPNTYTNISKGKISTTNSTPWNNLGYKEIKYKNNFSKTTYNSVLNNNKFLNRNDLFQSYNYNNNYGATAKNIGFYHSLNSILYPKKPTKELFNSYNSTLTNSYNNHNNKNFSLLNYYKNIKQISNAREGLNSKIIKDRMNDKENIKKINKIQAIWKGIYVRELMSYYWNFDEFQKNLEKILDKHYKKDFYNKLKNFGLKQNLDKKKEECDKLLNDYNNIMKEFNEYKKKNLTKKINEYIIEKKINFDILSSIKIDNIEIISNGNKEEENNIILRARSKPKNFDYLEHFKRNLEIINNDIINIQKIKKENILEINKSFFSLINNTSKDIESNNKILSIENQEGLNFKFDKKFNKEDLYIEKNYNLNTLGKKDISHHIKKENIISNNDKFNIISHKKENKQLCGKFTEAINEINIINQNNNIISNNDKFNIISLKKENKQLCDNFTETINYDINIINPNDKNNNKIFIKENNYIEYKKEIKNYNSVNEIEIGEGIEINPYEIKRSKYEIKMSHQNDINVLISNNNNKQKNNLMRIILPIKLKTIIIRYMKNKHFLYLIKELKKISFIFLLLKIKKIYEKKLKKEGIEKLKEKVILIKIRNYFNKEMAKNKIKNFAKKYLYYRWNKGLVDLSNIIIKNKK